jgi:hypothetical protein
MRRTTIRCCLLLVASLGGCGQTALPSDNGDLAASSDLAGSADLELPVSELDLGMQCTVPARPNATIGGTTPSGTFAGQFAWVGYQYGTHPTLDILRVTQSADPQSPSSPYLVVSWQSVPVIGEQAVAVTLVDGGMQINAAGRVTLTVAEPAGSSATIQLAGTLAVNELGGKLTLMGDFSAAHCALIDQSYP